MTLGSLASTYVVYFLQPVNNSTNFINGNTYYVNYNCNAD